MRKKCAKDSAVPNVSSISDVSQSLSSVKEFSKSDDVQDPHENSQFYDQNLEEMISMVYSDVNSNIVNNFSSEVLVNGLHSETEINEKHFISQNLSIQNYDGGDNDSKIANGYSLSSTESCNDSWTDQEFLIANIPHESFKSCQSSLQSSLSSISSSLSSNKMDYHDDGKLAHVSHREMSHASNCLHKSIPSDDLEGAKLDVLSNFDDYEVCLHSNPYELTKDRNDALSSLDAYSKNTSRQNKLNPVNSCSLRDFDQNVVSHTSSDFMFGDFSSSKTNLKCSSDIENDFPIYDSCSISLDDGNLEKVEECHKVIASPIISSTHNDTSCYDVKCQSDKQLFRAPVEFVNCTAEDLNSNSSLGISFGFGLEDLLGNLQAELPDLSDGGKTFASKENLSAVTSCMNLSFNQSFIVTTCLSSPVLYSRTSASSTILDAKSNAIQPSIISNVPNFLSPNNNHGSGVSVKNNNLSLPVCKHEYSSKGNLTVSVQESNYKFVKKNESRPSVHHKNLISHASNSIFLPSFYDQKLHVSLNMPIKNGFMRSNFSNIYHASKKSDMSDLPSSSTFMDSGSRMDELDNCFLPPTFHATSHNKNTFNLKAAQRFLYESYKETLLQSQSYIDKSFFKSKSSRFSESRGPNKNLKLAMIT